MKPTDPRSAKMQWLAAMMVYHATATRSAYEVMQQAERTYVAAYRFYGPPAAAQVVARRSQRGGRCRPKGIGPSTRIEMRHVP